MSNCSCYLKTDLTPTNYNPLKAGATVAAAAGTAAVITVIVLSALNISVFSNLHSVVFFRVASATALTLGCGVAYSSAATLITWQKVDKEKYITKALKILNKIEEKYLKLNTGPPQFSNLTQLLEKDDPLTKEEHHSLHKLIQDFIVNRKPFETKLWDDFLMTLQEVTLRYKDPEDPTETKYGTELNFSSERELLYRVENIARREI